MHSFTSHHGYSQRRKLCRWLGCCSSRLNGMGAAEKAVLGRHDEGMYIAFCLGYFSTQKKCSKGTSLYCGVMGRGGGGAFSGGHTLF